MGNKTPKVYGAAFKKQVVMELMNGVKTKGEICSHFGIHSSQADRWRQIVVTRMDELFKDTSSQEVQRNQELIDNLYKQIGKLQVELEWLKKKMGLIR